MSEKFGEIKPADQQYPPEFDPTNENSDISVLYKLMKEQELKETDAVIWLEGNVEDRIQKCVNLIQSNLSKELVVSGGAERGGDLPIQKIHDIFVNLGVSEKKIVMETASRNTKDQALKILEIVRDKGWKKITLVANPYHQIRAFLTLLAELDKEELTDEIEIINASADLNWFSVPAGDRKKDEVDLLDQEEIPRLIKYSEQGDVAKPAQGIEYLEKWQARNIEADKK